MNKKNYLQSGLLIIFIAALLVVSSLTWNAMRGDFYYARASATSDRQQAFKLYQQAFEAFPQHHDYQAAYLNATLVQGFSDPQQSSAYEEIIQNAIIPKLPPQPSKPVRDSLSMYNRLKKGLQIQQPYLETFKNIHDAALVDVEPINFLPDQPTSPNGEKVLGRIDGQNLLTQLSFETKDASPETLSKTILLFYFDDEKLPEVALRLSDFTAGGTFPFVSRFVRQSGTVIVESAPLYVESGVEIRCLGSCESGVGGYVRKVGE
ncbi:MAG: hypothetical protein WCP97_08910 [bacterium]